MGPWTTKTRGSAANSLTSSMLHEALPAGCSCKKWSPRSSWRQYAWTDVRTCGWPSLSCLSLACAVLAVPQPSFPCLSHRTVFHIAGVKRAHARRHPASEEQHSFSCIAVDCPASKRSLVSYHPFPNSKVRSRCARVAECFGCSSRLHHLQISCLVSMRSLAPSP